jgi:hypothetical protein
MSESAVLGFPEAARRLGVPVRVLREAIRRGRVPAPPVAGALAALPADWMARVEAAIEASPGLLSRSVLQRGGAQSVPAFARYEGTSAWRKYRHRVRAFADFRAGGSK